MLRKDVADHPAIVVYVLHHQYRPSTGPILTFRHGSPSSGVRHCMKRTKAVVQRAAQRTSRSKRYNSLHVHGIAEIAEQLCGATATGFLFVKIARFAADQFLVVVCHGPAADPVSVVVNVNMIEFRHPGCAASPAIDTIAISYVIKEILAVWHEFAKCVAAVLSSVTKSVTPTTFPSAAGM